MQMTYLDGVRKVVVTAEAQVRRGRREQEELVRDGVLVRVVGGPPD